MFDKTKYKLMGATAGLALAVGSLGGVAVLAHAQAPAPTTSPPAVTQPVTSSATNQQVTSGSQTAPDTGAAAKESATEAPETANGKEAPETTKESKADPAGGLQSQVQQTGQFQGEF